MPNSDHNSVECEPYSVNYTQRIGKILELRHKKDRIKRDDILVSRSHGESFRTLTTDLSRSHSRERTFGIVSSIDSTNKRSNSRERSSSLNNNNNNNNNVIDLTNERIIKSFEKEMQLQRDIIAKERQEAALLQVKQESYINFLKNKGNSPWLPNGGGGTSYESASAHASINKSATKQGLIQKAWMRSPWPGLIKTSASTNGNSGNPSVNNSFTSTVASHKRVDDSRFAVSKIAAVADSIVSVTNKRSTRNVSPNNRDDTLSIASSHHNQRSSDNSSTGRLRSLSADRIMPLRSSTNERMLLRSRSGSRSTTKAGRDNHSSKYIALTVRLIDVASADTSMSHGVFIVPKGCTKVELIASIEKQFNVFDKISDISITYRSGYEHKVLVKSLSMSTIEEVPVIDEYSSITVFLNGDTIFDCKGNNNVIARVSKASLENAVLTLSSTIGKELLLKSGIDIAAADSSSSNKTEDAVEAVSSQTRFQQQHEHNPSTALPPLSSLPSSSSPLVDLQLLSDVGLNHHQVHVHGGNNNSQWGKLNFEQSTTTGISEKDQLYSFSPSSASLRRCIPTSRTIITGVHPFSASSNMPLAGIASERTVNPLSSVQSRSEVVFDEAAHLMQDSSAFSPKRTDDRAGDNYYNYTDDYDGRVSPTSTNDNSNYQQRNGYGGGAELTIRHLTGTAHSFDDNNNDEDFEMIQLQLEINQLKRADHSRKAAQTVINPPQTTNSVDPPSSIQSVVSSKLIDFNEYKSKLVGSAHSKGKRPYTPSIGIAATTTTSTTTSTTTTTGAIVTSSGARAATSTVDRDKKSNSGTVALKGVTKLEIERYDRVHNDDAGHDDDDDGDMDFHPTLAPSDGDNILLDNSNNNSISIDLESRDDFAIDLYDSLLNDDEGKTVGSYLDEHIHQLRDSYFKKSSSSIIITTSNSLDDNYNQCVVEAMENRASSLSSSIEPSVPISVGTVASNSRSTSSSKHREVASKVMDASSNHDDGDHDAVKKISSVEDKTMRIELADIQSSSLDDRLSQLQRQHTSFLRSSSSTDTVHDYHTNSHTLFDDGNNNNNNKYQANNNNNLLPVVSTDAIDGHRDKQQSSHPRSNNRQFLSNDDHHHHNNNNNNNNNNSFPSSSPLIDGSIHSNGIYVRHNSSERRRRDYITNKLQAKSSLSHNNNQPVLATKDYFERNQDIKSRYSAAAMLSMMPSSSESSSHMYARNTISSSTKREYSRSSSVTERIRSKSPSGISSSSSSSSSSTAGHRIKPNPPQSLHHHHYHVSDTTSINSHSTNSQQVFYASALLDNNDDDHEKKKGRRNAAYAINDDYVDEDNRSRSSSVGYDRHDYYESSAHNKHVVVVDNNHQHDQSTEGTSHHSTTTSNTTTEWDRRTAKHQQQLKHQPYRPAKYDAYREDTEVFQTLSTEKKTSSSSYILDDNDYDYGNGDGGRNASSTQSDVDARSITRSTATATTTILDNYAADDVVRDILSNTKIRGVSNRQVYIKLDELLANL